MADTATMTVRLETSTKDRLERLAAHTRRTKSFLAAEAIDEYVARELKIIEGIEEGLADARAGDLIPHREAMAQLREVIKRTQKKNP
jgi:predicted transcriptional regulator